VCLPPSWQQTSDPPHPHTHTHTPVGASSCRRGSDRPHTSQRGASAWRQRPAGDTIDGCGRWGRTDRSRRLHSRAEGRTRRSLSHAVVTSGEQDGGPTCSVLQVKSDCSSPQTLSAATTSTMTRKINSTESQTLPRLVEWRLAPTN